MIVHAYSDFEAKDPATRARNALAKTTWSTQMWVERPIGNAALKRLWQEEERTYPYLKDLLDLAVKDADGNDIIVFTNTDICVRSDCALQVAAALQDSDAIYCYRRDFNQDFSEPIPDELIVRGDDYVGSDLYAFRVHWWLNHREDFPDMLVGHEAWDPILRYLMEQTNPGCEVVLKDLIYHRRHDSWWENPKNRYRLKGQLHNILHAIYWMRKHGLDPARHGLRPP